MKSTAVWIGAIVPLASCTMGPVHVEEDFGRSVRQMVEGQIHDPDVAANPSPVAADALDGVGAERSLEAYRRGGRGEGGARTAIDLSVN